MYRNRPSALLSNRNERGPRRKPRDTGNSTELKNESVRRRIARESAYLGDVNVLNVSKLGVKDFDVVINCGIYYHLKDPLLAFARLRQVMKEGAILVVSGMVTDSPEVFAKFYYREYFAEDSSNWWVPTVPCLRQWVECSFFKVLTQHQTHPTNCSLTARAVKRKDPHYKFPDTELAEFDLNTYS
jgi:SAM-dependent methyltransferase